MKKEEVENAISFIKTCFKKKTLMKSENKEKKTLR